LLLCFISTTFWQCQKEELEIEQPIPTKGIPFEVEVPQVESYFVAESSKGKVIDKLFKALGYTTRTGGNVTESYETGIGTILTDEILAVQDVFGTKYTFKLDHPEKDFYTFFNLLMVEKEEKTIVHLLKYKMTPEFAELYRSGQKQLDSFEGTTTSFVLANPCLCEFPTDGMELDVIPGDYTQTPGGGTVSGTGPGSSTGGVLGGGALENGSPCGVVVFSVPGYVTTSTGTHLKNFVFRLNTCTGEFEWSNDSNRKTRKDANQTETLNENGCCSFGVIGILDPSSKEEDMIEERINDLDLDPCSKTILNQLKNLQQNDISKILQRFNNVPYVYNLTYKTAIPLINPLNSAETDWVRDLNDNPVLQNYLIHINPNYVNQATKTAIARTILHEMLHAHLLAIVDDIGLANSIVDPREFPVIYNAISNNIQSNTEAIHHQQMSMKYILPLRDALKEWDNSNQPDQYYEDLAWGALYNTSTFNFYHPQGSISRQRIIARNQAEDTNSVVNTPTVSYIPLGTGC
jgi:hypothetical protein